MSSTIEQSIEVDVPVATAYNQWTQFEEFPQFMEGVESVQQIDDRHLLWTAAINGQREEWKAEITQQVPDRRIAWRAVDGKPNSGVVTFDPLGETRTAITVQLEFEPEGVMQKLGSALGSDDRQVKGDLERFKEFVETRGVETGAWRGSV